MLGCLPVGEVVYVLTQSDSPWNMIQFYMNMYDLYAKRCTFGNTNIALIVYTISVTLL